MFKFSKKVFVSLVVFSVITNVIFERYMHKYLNSFRRAAREMQKYYDALGLKKEDD